MKHMTSAEIRSAFLDYFQEMHHQVVPSSSLVPGKDPTLLFTNAGMVQFKDVFLGLDKRPYTRATTSQKCMRVSGKHNDLENVGPSPRHHTFFEMLGNFSFGDYFKRDACRFAFSVLTEVYGIPLERLYFTVHVNDNDAYAIWTQDVGVPAERVYRLGDKTNFWQMADVGPCGYTSEIHFDWEPERGPEAVAAELEESTGRVLELWNLVFMQFNQTADGKREPLPAPGVDTGMGLERVVSVLQGVRTNYENDLFVPILDRVQQLNGASLSERKADEVPYRVIADHVRAAAFLIADGVIPGPKDRGYVCRMVIRRAARFGKKIGFNKPFLADVADTVIDIMGGHYAELRERREAIRKALTQEEIRFGRTLERGLSELDTLLAGVPAGGTLPGEKAFFLKATLGLPLEVTRDVAAEQGYLVDEAGFLKAQNEHEIASGGGQAMGEIDMAEVYSRLLSELKTSGALPAAGVAYNPYGALEAEVKVLAVVEDGKPIERAEVGDRVEIVLDKTVFYVEAGGQVSDTGAIRGDGWTVDIEDTRRPVGGLIVHVGEVVEGVVSIGAIGRAQVDAARRLEIMRNHTATHLLHAELRSILGTHVQQRGSLVAPDRLRFDFSHDAPVTAAELSEIAARINTAILTDLPVITVEKDLATARAEGAMALFGEKYGERVRTVTIDKQGERYSYELCGGTHVAHTGTIANFVFTGETSVSQGVRRVEALTGSSAAAYVADQLATLRGVAAELTTTPEQVAVRIHAIKDEVGALKRENERLRRQLARVAFDLLFEKRVTLNGATVLVAQAEPTAADTLREMTDWFREKAHSGVIVLGTVYDGKPTLIASVSDDLTKKIHAGNLIKTIAPIVGGGGGGRPTMAQAGGKDPAKLADALAEADRTIQAALGGSNA
jgi:alanyl-tRNA synthetase